jgi:hypothetical protein
MCIWMNTKQTIIFRCGTSKWKTKQKKKRSQYKPDQQESTTWWAALIPFLLKLVVKMFVLICLGVQRVCMSKCPHAWICVSLPNMPICLYSNLCCYRLTVNLYQVSFYNIFEIRWSCKYRDVHRTEQYLCTSVYSLQWMGWASYDI